MADAKTIGAKTALHIACWAPAAWITWLVLSDQAGANPIEFATRETGHWVLRFLLITLTVSPLARLAGMPYLVTGYRRMLGLYAFTYGIIHWLTYLWLDQFFDWGEILRDTFKRPFIFAGMTGFLLLVPLAATSTRAAVVKLGIVWKRIHRLVYAAVVAGILHYWWQVRADYLEVAVYTVILAGLFGVRLYFVYARAKRGRA